MKFEYDSRKNCASQMKREQFFSRAYFAIPLPTVNCQLSTVNWTHTFSAKEKDAETGLSYFGSRYYSSDLSIWLSVDPMSDKYPSLSPYTYCANNPIKLVDPDGEDFIGALVGCLVGAATEIVSQTIANGMEYLSNGEGFFKDWSKKIDWADVGISAVEGTLDGLLPGTGKLAGELIGDVAKAAIDWKGENKSVMGSGWGIVGFSKDPKEFACDLVANMVSTGFSHVSGLGNLAVERNHFDVSSMMFESALKGSVLGLLGTINKMVKKDYITSRHLNVQTNFIVGPAVLKRIEP